jgi:Spy/CpxP family protein refolding chaperone
MNRFRLFSIGTLLIVALAAPAQQTAAGPGSTDKDEHSAQSGVPSVEQHLKLLTEKLDLTVDQQASVKPILQEMQDGTQKLMQDQSLTREERLEKVKPLRMKADKQIREVLNDDQKKRLDQLEQEAHPELHGNLNGSTPQS